MVPALGCSISKISVSIWLCSRSWSHEMDCVVLSESPSRIFHFDYCPDVIGYLVMKGFVGIERDFVFYASFYWEPMQVPGVICWCLGVRVMMRADTFCTLCCFRSKPRQYKTVQNQTSCPGAPCHWWATCWWQKLWLAAARPGRVYEARLEAGLTHNTVLWSSICDKPPYFSLWR